MTKTYVLNTTAFMVEVEIENAAGERDFIFSMPGGKPHLPEGWSVTAQALAKNPGLRLIEQPAPVVAEAPAAPVADNSKKGA